MIPVTYGYARVSKTDDESRNLETQLRELAAHGIRQDLIFTDTASGRTMDRNGWAGPWKNLMARVQPEDTVVVAFLDRFSRNFEEGVAIQADLTKRDIAIVALRKQIDTREDSAAAKFFRRAMLAQGPTKWSRPARASAWGWRGPGRWQEHRPAPVPECGAGGTVPAHGRGGGKQATDRPGPQLLTLDGEEGACQLRNRDGVAMLVRRYLAEGSGAPCGTGFRRDPGHRGRRRFPDPRSGPRCPAVSRPVSPGP